jgi:hypothetical protein
MVCNSKDVFPGSFPAEICLDRSFLAPGSIPGSGVACKG